MPSLLRRTLSRMRHGLTDADLLARGYAVTHPSGAVVLPAEPGWDQLLYAVTGVMRVEAGAEVWVVPPHRALWLPDGERTRIVMHGRVAVRTLYLHNPFLPAADPLPRRRLAVDVAPLLRELVLHAVHHSPLQRGRPDHRRIVEMIRDRLAEAPHAPLRLPAPADPRAAALADALAADPATSTSLARLAAGIGTSRRTLERLFLAGPA